MNNKRISKIDLFRKLSQCSDHARDRFVEEDDERSYQEAALVEEILSQVLPEGASEEEILEKRLEILTILDIAHEESRESGGFTAEARASKIRRISRGRSSMRKRARSRLLTEYLKSSK